MFQYVSFARKYRPKLLADVFGQEVLTKILNYSIQKNQLVSSFLFTGIRGIGKTTSARIVAQTINCTDQKVIKDLVCSCQECANCQAFKSNAHPDIVEIDAASYTSVDNIRDVIEKAIYMPLLGRYKVFIIDEVHMLSKSAFNALLKTLEEPPAYVIFILLTTELSKVPITILSRCQKFNLRRLNINELVALLEYVCAQESIDYQKQALESIAYKADGSARDALVLLEQTSFLARQQNTQINAKIVCESLDLNIYKHSIDFLSLILEQNAPAAMELVDELYQNNFDFINIIQSMIELIAFLSKLKLIPAYEWGHYNSYRQDIQKILDSVDLAFLTSLWQILSKEIGPITHSQNQLASFEMLVVKAIYCSMIPAAHELQQGSAQGQIANHAPAATLFIGAELAKKKVLNCVESDALKNTASQINIPEDISMPASEISKLQERYLDAPYFEPDQVAPDRASQVENISTAPKVAVSSMVVASQVDDALVGGFLKYMHQNNMFDLYDFIMHKCEIIIFKPHVLKVNAEKISSQIKDQVDFALNSWMPASWQVSCTITSKIQSLQSKLKAAAALGANFKLIASFFPKVELRDVLFNFMIK